MKYESNSNRTDIGLLYFDEDTLGPSDKLHFWDLQFIEYKNKRISILAAKACATAVSSAIIPNKQEEDVLQA